MSTFVQIRLTPRLKRAWQTYITDQLGSRILRIFMRKAIAALKKRKSRLFNLATGQYTLSFYESSAKNPMGEEQDEEDED